MDASPIKPKRLTYVALIASFLLYSFASICSKGASQHEFLSWPYILFVTAAVLVLGVFAILWQQIIKRIPISDAYMFKGTSLIFVLLLSHLFFGETITLTNCIGAAIIIAGIALYAKS